MIARRKTSIALVILSILAVGSGANPSGTAGQDGPGAPTSMGKKCAVCIAAGCPDRSTTHCASADFQITAGMKASILKAGFEVEVGASINVTCYQGPADNPCVVDPNPS